MPEKDNTNTDTGRRSGRGFFAPEVWTALEAWADGLELPTEAQLAALEAWITTTWPPRRAARSYGLPRMAADRRRPARRQRRVASRAGSDDDTVAA